MAHIKFLIIIVFVFSFTTDIMSKIVLPHKLRYLENMLNSEVIAKAAKIRQQMGENPNIREDENKWPLILAKYEQDEKGRQPPTNNFYNMGRRMTFK